MDTIDVKNIEAQDYDIIENTVVALREIWKKKIFVALITIVGFLSALIFVNVIGNTTRYYSSATVFSAVYGSYSDTAEGVTVMNRYTDLISSSRVCNKAAQMLVDSNITAEDLKRMVSSGNITISGASSSANSYGYQLTIGVHSDSQELVVPIANAMSSSFASELNELLGSDAIQVMDEATEFASYRTVNTMMYLLLFTGGAFVLSCMIIFLVAFFSPWVQSVQQCEQDEDLVLGMLPYAKEK